MKGAYDKIGTQGNTTVGLTKNNDNIFGEENQDDGAESDEIKTEEFLDGFEDG